MSDLISRKAMIDEIRLIEKDLLQDKNDAENSDDGEMMFAINNQLNVLWRVKSRVRGLPTAYDVDKVVKRLEKLIINNKSVNKTECEAMDCLSTDCIECMTLHAIDIVKGAVKDE